jgi:hypothetical protein
MSGSVYFFIDKMNEYGFDFTLAIAQGKGATNPSEDLFIMVDKTNVDQYITE